MRGGEELLVLDVGGEMCDRSARPSLAPLERAIWAFPRSHENSTDWACASLASGALQEPNRPRLHYASLGAKPGYQREVLGPV